MTAAAAFLVRDFHVAWSYRFNFLFQNAAMMFSVVSLQFLGQLINAGSSPDLETYGNDYFSFALLGVSISLLAYPIIKSFPDSVRSAQVTGTFEATLLGRSSASGVVVAGALYTIAATIVQWLLLLSIGTLVFGADIQLGALWIFSGLLLLTIASLMGIGLCAAAFVVVFKQKEPFSGGLVAVSLLVSGILYPTSVLPVWLERIAPLFPLTHTVELARRLFIRGAAPSELVPHVLALAAFALLLPLGLVALSIAVRMAKRAGTLSQY